MKNKRTRFLLFIALLLTEITILANNIEVSNVSLRGTTILSDYSFVKFDLSWENSWRTSTGPVNWDAAWVFAKYRKRGSLTWSHMYLNNTGHNPGAGTGATIAPGLLMPKSAFNYTTNPALGVFIYRSSNGTGKFGITSAEIKWNFGANGLSNGDSVEICLFAIEMAYVPQASFYLGSGGTENYAIYKYPTTTNVYQVTSESGINVGTTSGYLYYGASGDHAGPIPNSFPKGFQAFYCMKYEVSQGQYVAFLNKLNRTQQNTRTASNIAVGVISVPNKYVLINYSSSFRRNGIACDVAIHTSNPIVFYNNLDGDAINNEANDGQHLACNYISWADLTAYLDWAALRPMTEFEFEKAARGSLSPVPNEYSWGNTTLNQATSVSNTGAFNETSNNGSNCAYGSAPSVDGPLRIGSFGQGLNSRTAVGAGYYGILELSGNLYERVVNMCFVTGRSFTGLNGNGELNANGDADASYWPNSSGSGGGFRGGSFSTDSQYIRISDRTDASTISSDRMYHAGGRGVRVAP